jgi:polyisoprenoid-binding protein YceI
MQHQLNSAIQTVPTRKVLRFRIGRRIIIGIVTTFVILAALFLVGVGSAAPAALAPLHLSQLSAATNAASPNGTWIAGNGSIAGFRVPESFLWQSGTIVGRTSAVTGTLVITNTAIPSGTFHVDLSKVTIGGKQNSGFVKMMDTKAYPEATLTLTQPITFTAIPTDGKTIASHAIGSLTLHGITRPVTFTITACYNGSVLEAMGTIPMRASDWGIKSPFGVENNAVIEFLVVLQRG